VGEKLHASGYLTYCLDGDNMRHGLCSDLSFTDADRSENIRRASEAAKLLMDAGVIALASFISPFAKDRQNARSIMPQGDFIEIYCKSSLSVCEKRDVKGLYTMARKGLIKNFTGIGSAYEVPENPDLVVDTEMLSPDQSIQVVLNFLALRGLQFKKA